MALQLHNSYWVLRHGRSKANDAGIIVSTIENGVPPNYGLSDSGRQQAEEAGEELKRQLAQTDTSTVKVFCSPLTRTLDTAVIVAETLGIYTTDSRFQVVPELIERNFGEYELQADNNYNSVWEVDACDVTAAPKGGGESVEQVAERIRSFIGALEKDNMGKSILLVSHGDTLSILWAVVKGLPLKDHRQHGLNTGQLKVLHAA
ncbi:g9907 [Coccomyxa elongata]